jgi:hypothetical protein
MHCKILSIFLFVTTFVTLGESRASDPEWVKPMKKIHARFSGTPGTLALFGDSITVSMAFWAPLRGEPKGMSEEMAAAHNLVKRRLCLGQQSFATFDNRLRSG